MPGSLASGKPPKTRMRGPPVIELVEYVSLPLAAPSRASSQEGIRPGLGDSHPCWHSLPRLPLPVIEDEAALVGGRRTLCLYGA